MRVVIPLILVDDCPYSFIKKDDNPFLLANVCVTCDGRRKQVLWNRSCNLIIQQSNYNWCVCEDFNSFCFEVEKRSRMNGSRVSDSYIFNSFIEDFLFFHFGRCFTWISWYGLSMSRIDRFLISREWS